MPFRPKSAPAGTWLVIIGLGSFLGAGLAAIAAVSTGSGLVMACFVLFAAMGGIAIHHADRQSKREVAAKVNAAPVRTFDDVAGLDEVRQELEELRDYVRNRSKYLALDAQLPRGVLLYGPPGTGKTLLAKGLAAESGASFHYVSGSGFVEKYVGVGSQRVRELFARARKSEPAIIFIDEIDAIGRQRSGGENAEWESTLNQLLTEIDGFTSTDNVLLVCATNRREILDSALLRPGRLDRQIYIGLPDKQAREAILRVHTRKKPLGPSVDLGALARRTPGLSGAHLAAVVNEAALTTSRTGRAIIEQSDFNQGIERVLAGLAGKSSVLSAEERRVVAFHEAGHAVVGFALGMGRIERISLLSRSTALGYVLQVPEEKLLHTRQWLKDRIATLLAGRAAEETFFGDLSTGSTDDLRKSTDIAESMVLQFGMGVRHRHYVVREQAYLLSQSYQAEVEAIVEEAWGRTLQIVETHRPALESLAMALLEKESLEFAEIHALLSGEKST